MEVATPAYVVPWAIRPACSDKSTCPPRKPRSSGTTKFKALRSQSLLAEGCLSIASSATGGAFSFGAEVCDQPSLGAVQWRRLRYFAGGDGDTLRRQTRVILAQSPSRRVVFEPPR